MTKTEAMKYLGAPTSIRVESLFYVHHGVKMIDGTDYKISNGVEMKIRNGLVNQISAFEISSN